MLSQIQPAAAEPTDAVDLLLGCHARIRHFTALAVRLSHTPEAPAGERAQAAQAVYRYYTLALPLHEADENESVYPRLRAAAPPAELAAANQAMVDQHRAIDGLIARLVPQWQALAEGMGTDPSASAPDADRLQAAWKEHLALEEELVFPALRVHLTAGEREAIRREMAERRKIPVDPGAPAGV